MAKNLGGAPKGNSNAAKGFVMSNRLRSRLEEKQAMDAIIEALILKASEGDMAAIKEVFDRVDGKPKQAIVGGDEDDAPITHKIIREIVNSKNSDG